MPDQTQTIRDTLARLESAARLRTPFGVMFPEDRAGIIKRTASLCGVTVDKVKEVAHD